MSNIIYKIIFVALIILVFASWYFGAYLPLKKSQLLIGAIQRANVAKSVTEFENVFLTALEFYSPVGQSESVKHTINSVFNILNQQNVPPEVAAELVNFVTKFSEPLLKAKQGDGLIQNFYVLGDTYRIAGMKYQNPAYLQKAAEIYEDGLVLAPKRPQFLYGLLQIYLDQRNPEAATNITRKILQNWPDDPAIKELLQ